MIIYFLFNKGELLEIIEIQKYDYFEFFRTNIPDVADIFELGDYYVKQLGCDYYEVNY